MLKQLLFGVILLSSALQAQTVHVERIGPVLDEATVGEYSAYNYDRESDEDPFVSIAGPSLIRVPDWIENPLGRYYLYFAHHKGGHIRMAYADELHGPWSVYQSGRGVLRIEDLTEWVEDHIASPDVHVDDEHQRIVMYFHGPQRDQVFEQHTWVATSETGLEFRLHSEEALGKPYFRLFRWGGYAFTPSRLGPIYRSRDGFHNFEVGPRLFDNQVRHFAVKVVNNRAFIFFSRIQDDPEHLKLVTIDLHADWSTWTLSPEIEVLWPTEDFEQSSGAKLLDPCIYEEEGRYFLLYSYSQERGIALARIHIDGWEDLNVSRVRAHSQAAYVMSDTTLAVGSSPFSDATASISQLPNALLGSPFLRSAMQDRRSNASSSFLRFHLNTPVCVLVGYDERHEQVPDWLSSWTRTADVISMTSSSATWDLQLYSKEYPVGEVVLGGNVFDGEVLDSNRSMFTVLFDR
ncbi:MAG: hypothetical protein ACI835_004197 [Planctomycetota bacterium]|jgi:hypothetical protein